MFLENVQIANQEKIIKPGERQNVSYNLRLFKPGTYQLIVDNKNYPVHVTYKKSSLDFVATQVSNIGENVRIQTIVQNNGSDVLDKKIALQINKKTISERTVNLQHGQQDTIHFAYTAPASGVYRIDINRVVQKELKVLLPACKPEQALVLHYDFTNAETPLLDFSCKKNYPLPGQQPSLEMVSGTQALRFESPVT